MTRHTVGTREEWLAARLELLGTQKHDIDLRTQELMAVSAFALEDGVVYHTYSAYDRGTDGLNATWQLLDRAPKGRDGGAFPADWPLRKDEYVDVEVTA